MWVHSTPLPGSTLPLKVLCLSPQSGPQSVRTLVSDLGSECRHTGTNSVEGGDSSQGGDTSVEEFHRKEPGGGWEVKKVWRLVSGVKRVNKKNNRQRRKVLYVRSSRPYKQNKGLHRGPRSCPDRPLSVSYYKQLTHLPTYTLT